MKKYILIITLILACSSISADNTYPFLMNYSANNVAVGYSGGISNVWMSGSSNNSGNPALLGYQIGMSYRFSHGDHFMTDVKESVISFGYKGLGITLPMPSYKGEFGLVHHIDFTPLMSVFGPVDDEYHYYEIFRKYSLGINLFEFINNFSNSEQKEKIFELSLGFTHNNNTMKYKIGSYAFSDNYNTQDYGANILIEPLELLNINSIVDLGVTAGVHFINPTRIRYRIDRDNDLDGQINEDPEDGIDNDNDGLIDEDGEEDPENANYDTRMGATLHAGLPLKKVSKAPPSYFIYHFSKNFISLTVNAETGNDYESIGGEFSLLDIFYYRTGYYEEYNNESLINDFKSTTSGYGIKLCYDDIVTIEYNTADIDEGGLFFPFDMYELGINADLLAVFGMLKLGKNK